MRRLRSLRKAWRRVMLKLNRDPLLSALTVVRTAVERKTTIPILSFVLLESGNGKVRITGTDIDRAATLTIDGEGEDSFCLPANQFYDLVKLAEGEIQIAPDGIVTGEGFRTKL